MALLPCLLSYHSNATVPNLTTITGFTEKSYRVQDLLLPLTPSKSKQAIETFLANWQVWIFSVRKVFIHPVLISLGEGNQQPPVLFPAHQHHLPLLEQGVLPSSSDQ